MTQKDRKEEFIIFRVSKEMKDDFNKKIKELGSNTSKVGRQLVAKFLK